MSTQTQRSYTSPAGTLTAFYHYNPAKEKNRLDQFSFQQGAKTTQLALSKIWVNEWPASHLKGFKSYVMPQEGVQLAQDQEIYDLTLPGSHFPTLSITLKILGDKEQTLTLKVPERLTVAGLKKIVSRQLKISDPEPLNFQYKGDSLASNNTLKECGFENGTTLTLDLSDKPQDKAPVKEKITPNALEIGEGFHTFDFVKADTAKMIPVGTATSKDPAWIIIDKGLNLKAQCTEKTCKAFKNTVYIQRGMGTFNMAEECSEAKCPASGHVFEKEVNNCVFWNCLYSIKGKMEDGTLFNEADKIAPKGSQAVTFEESVNGVSNIMKWRYLNITTKPSV